MQTFAPFYFEFIANILNRFYNVQNVNKLSVWCDASAPYYLLNYKESNRLA